MLEGNRREQYLQRCPRDWAQRRIDEVGTVQAGRQRATDVPNGELKPYLRVANVYDGRIDRRDVLEMPFTPAEWPRYRLEPGDILLNEGQSLDLVGRAAMYIGHPTECGFQNSLIRFKAGPEIDKNFALSLFRYFQASGVFSEIAVQTTSIAHLGVSRFAGLCIALPPLSQQRKIAAIVSSVDDAIDSTQAVIDQLQVVKQAMMAELFTRGLPGRHTRFKRTEIGLLPDSWLTLPLATVLAEGPSNGRSPPSKTTPPGVPTFSIGAVRDGRVDIAPNIKFAETEASAVRGALVRQGDILIVRGNGNPDLVGRCGIVTEQPPDGCIYPDILMRVRLSADLGPQFFVSIWNGPLIREQVLNKAKTTNGTYKINGQDVRSVVVPVPTRGEQDQIAEVLFAIDDDRDAHVRKLAGLSEIKSALLSALLTGEVRVTPDEEGAR